MNRILFVAAALISGCSHIAQTVSPVAKNDDKKLCVIENPEVKASFLPTARKALAEKGFEVKMLPKDASTKDCPRTLTYKAEWRWDLLLYLEEAEIVVFRNGVQAGKANYDAKNAGLNFSKFIGAENKIRELVDNLFK